MSKACCVLASQVPPSPGLFLRSPARCFSSLRSETTLQAYLQGLQPPATAVSGNGHPASVGNSRAFWAGMGAVAEGERNPRGGVWEWG